MQSCLSRDQIIVQAYKKYILEHQDIFPSEIGDEYAEMLATVKINEIKYGCEYDSDIKEYIDLIDQAILSDNTLIRKTKFPSSIPIIHPFGDLPPPPIDDLPPLSDLPPIEDLPPPPPIEDFLPPIGNLPSPIGNLPPPIGNLPPPIGNLPPPIAKTEPTKTRPALSSAALESAALARPAGFNKPIKFQPTQTTQLPPEEPFPYKKEFLSESDLTRLWNNAVTKDYVIFRNNLKLPFNNNNRPYEWSYIPQEFDWSYDGNFSVFVVDNKAYEEVDILIDYFSEEARMKARIYNKKSPYETYECEYRNLQIEAKKLQQEYIQKYGEKARNSRFWLREAIYGRKNECTFFKISLAKAIYKKFMIENDVLSTFDPSSGWGDRMMGAAAAGLATYHGNDPNPAVWNSYENIREFLRKQNFDDTYYHTYKQDFLQLDLDDYVGQYDLVFTSPPFFDYEIYSTEQGQSIIGRSKLSEWIEEFLKPYLYKSWQLIRPGGILALYIADVGEKKYVTEMYNYVVDELGGIFKGIIAVVHSVTNLAKEKALPLWVWQKEGEYVE